MASNSNLNREALEELSCHWSWMVREAVAENPNTPLEIIRKLAQDPDQSVQKAAMGRLKQ